MPLKKLSLKPGINREVTRYTSETGWYECDKIRFRQGFPEKIGGWQQISSSTFLGVCRSLWTWSLLSGSILRGVGTHLKFYIEKGGLYYDVTPLRATETLTDPFATTLNSTTVVVTDAAGGFSNRDFVTFSGATAVGGVTVDGEYQITYIGPTSYSIDVSSAATATATGGGTVTAEYQVNTGEEVSIAYLGWGAGPVGEGGWSEDVAFGGAVNLLRLWNQANFGEDLIYAPVGGELYYWDATNGTSTRGVLLSSLAGASDVPVVHKLLSISDISRFVFVFGCNALGDTTYDPLLIRWSDQEDATNWTPAATNQAGSIRLSRGSRIMAVMQARQEQLVWTNTSLYSLQFIGAPIVWQAQIVGENISILGKNAVAYANGFAFWMGEGRFYKYDGRTQPLRCDLQKYIFNDINEDQYAQVFAGNNEEFHEIWWFYCSAESTKVDRYVIYNYLSDIWYYGTMARTAWLQSLTYPFAATYLNNLVVHEFGIDDHSGTEAKPLPAFATSGQFDIDDGHRYGFVYRILPDVSFDGSAALSPRVTMSLTPLDNSGSGYHDPKSVAGEDQQTVTRTASVPVQEYDGQVYIRVRGRQMSLKVSSEDLGVTWQLGSPRIDLRPDGRR